MKNKLIFFAFILLLISCNQNDKVKFSEPQPRKVKLLSILKIRFWEIIKM